MKCSVCKRSDKPVYRSNPKGKKAIWKCEDCIETKVSNDVKEIVNDLQI